MSFERERTLAGGSLHFISTFASQEPRRHQRDPQRNTPAQVKQQFPSAGRATSYDVPDVSLLPGSALGMTETFGQRLRRLREEQGMSVPELASAVGASEGTIRQLESGNVKNPAFALGLRIADKLNVDPHVLALGTGFSMLDRFELLEGRIDKLEQRVATLTSALRR